MQQPWSIPPRFNIAAACCDRWADGSGRPAIIHLHADGRTDTWSFDALQAAANRLANAIGAKAGDRIGILLPQGPDCAIAHLAAYKAGAIAVPLFQLFGPDALEHRLCDSGAETLITDATGRERIAGITTPLRTIREAAAPDASPHFTTRDTAADDPALIIYTSGTTGPAKGALHAHRTLLGHLPGVEIPHDGFPQRGDLFWTPADWAWIGGLLDVLLPSLFHGVPVLAHRMAKFEPEAALSLMARHGVRNAFIPPTALRMLRTVPDAARFGARPRSIASGGESLGAELLDWGRETFGLTINEFYGQTECNLVIGCGLGHADPRPGWMGRAFPGHTVAVVDPHGTPLPPGEEGVIAMRRPDPVMFLGYWNNAPATAAKFAGDWLLTGDRGVADDQGWFRFVGRDDDVITSAGYRIGPGEIEDCLLRHPAIAQAAVIGVPDALRTERVVAVIVPRPGITPVAADIQAWVRDRLAAHLYPREVLVVDALPLTATGKIKRGELRRSLAD